MNILIIIVLLVIAAETSYLAVQSTSKLHYKRKYVKPIFVDTSVLIDGRIISVAQSGFITGTLYIPRSVIGELQLLADQADHEKRTRARHGLDIVKELQALPQVSVEIFPDSNIAEEGVDNRLLKLAKQYHGSVCTIDFNLNKVAQVEKIPVLNVNDLAKNLRMAYLPGERIMIELTQKGNDSHQAIGHLVDGTMVVVEQAYTLIGKKVEIEFIRSLQTAAGKMMFARLTEKPKAQPKVVKPLGTKPVAVVAEAVQKIIEKPAQKSTRTPRPPRAPKEQHVASSEAPQEAEVQQSAQRVQTAQVPAKAPYKKNYRRRSKEDDLIDLVNSQDD